MLLDRKGIKNDIGHGMGVEKNAAFRAVKDVLEKGRIILPLGYYGTGGKKQETGFIGAPIEINGERYVCAVGVIANTENRRLYIHEVYLTKKLQEDVASNLVHSSDTASPQPQGEVAKLLQKFVAAKNNLQVSEYSGGMREQRREKWNNGGYTTRDDGTKVSVRGKQAEEEGRYR